MSLPQEAGKPNITIHAKGIQEAIGLVNDLYKNEIPRTVNEALHTLGDQMVTQMQEKAPVDTGYLRDHITSNVIENSLFVDSSAPYSGFVNFGTKYIEPQPYFSDVVELVAPGFTAMVRKDAIAQIDRLIREYKPSGS